ncbi:MAG TPA: hypothetical protein PLU81_08620 [Deltaproteobacteria bacterium]|nr:hypothetical protein [Deltaproteobacteria bacterium]
MDIENTLDENKRTGIQTAEPTGSQQISMIPFTRRDLITQSSKNLKQKTFLNSVNHVHFMCGQIFANIVHTVTNQEYLIRVTPEPCRGTEITCALPENIPCGTNELELKTLLIDDGKIISVMPVETISLNSSSFKARIQEKGYIFSERNGKRFRCSFVTATIKQEENVIEGILDDFNPNGLKIVPNDSFETWIVKIDLSKNLNIDLYRQEQCVFSGPCRCIRKEDEGNAVILEPLNIEWSIYKGIYIGKKNRNPRLNLVPSPKITFDHPFIRNRVTYDISDITSSGFSIHERIDQSFLMPGMIIKDMDIVHAGEITLRCDAQIVYAKKRDNRTLRFGFAILDIEVKTYNRLFNILSNAEDPNAQISYEVEMNALWDFFFESGFFYPEKYLCISRYKEEFKNTYEKLYHNCQEIFASITYQENGKIYGHVSLIKAYEKTWMVHHLAAKHMGRKRTGLFVLNQILNYLDGFYRMPSIGMKYLIFYFRPENKFPDFFFGDACRSYNQPTRCSMDIFAHLTLDLLPQTSDMPDGWSIRISSPEDIEEMKKSYEQISGGLMIDAFCLDTEDCEEKSLETVYAEKGLNRKYNCHTLICNDERKAYLIADHSNKGINLSELLNSVKVFVPDAESVPWNVMHHAISKCGHDYGTKNITLHVFPCEYLDSVGVNYEKRYNMWVLDVRYIDQIIDYIKQKYRFTLLKMAKSFLKDLFRK